MHLDQALMRRTSIDVLDRRGFTQLQQGFWLKILHMDDAERSVRLLAGMVVNCDHD